MPGTQPIANGATPSFNQSYPSLQSITINSALLSKLNLRLISRGSDLRLNFSNLTWANISIALYGTAAFSSQLSAMNGGGSGPEVNEPDWVTGLLCAVDDDYCWETYAEASIRIPSNQSLDQFLASQPAQPAQPSQPAQPAQPPVINPPVQPPPPPVQPPVQPPVHTADATSDVTPPPVEPKLKNISVNGEQAVITVQNLNLREPGIEIEISAQEGSSIFFENAEISVTAENRFTVPIDTSTAYTGTWRISVAIHKADGTVVNLSTHLNIQAPAEE